MNKLGKYIWFNGKIIKLDEAQIPIMTHSLHYAGSVFEGQRAYNGRIFKLAEHTQRLLESARLIYLPVHYNFVQIKQANIDILSANQLQNAYIRPVIWRGPESLGIYDKSLKSNLAIFVSASNPVFQPAMTICLSPWRKAPANVLPPQSKASANYGPLTMSQKMAKDQGFDDALLLDYEDNIAEISSANIFFVNYKENGNIAEIVTPIADRFLNGITRQTIIDLLQQQNYKLVEKRLRLDELKNYQTCFVTGTSLEVRAVKMIEFMQAGKKNRLNFDKLAIVAKLQNLYAQLVGKVIDA